MQSLSAKLGIATGMNLPEHCGQMFSRAVNWGYGSIATVAAMATDLAEFLEENIKRPLFPSYNA